MAAGALGWAAAAGAASTVDVVAVLPGQDTASLVVGVRPPPAPTRPGVFEVRDAAGRDLGARTVPVFAAQMRTAVVLDTSAAGAPALQGGVNGATSFLLQLPDGSGTTVVGDGGERPTVLAPYAQGATSAIGAVNGARSGGERHPGAALDAALGALPAAAGQPRLLLVYTGAADAGGEPAAALGRRLAAAGVLLAVVTTGSDEGYWSQAAAATGGVLVSARDAPTLRPFDQVAGSLRERFVVTVPRPAQLPASVQVSVRIGSATSTAAAVIPAEPAAVPADPGSGTPWWLLYVLLAVALVAAALVARRRTRPAATPATPAATAPPADAPPPSGPPPFAPPPFAPPPGPRPAADEATAPPAVLPRRRPGASTPPPGAGRPSIGTDGRLAPADRTPADRTPADRTPADRTPADATGGPPAEAAGLAPGAAAAGTGPWPRNPAADERAYERLDDTTSRVADLVAAGRMDSGRAVARIALCAPGRVDLLDRVIEVERRLSGAQLGTAAPSETVLALLAEARRVLVGELALVGPDGARVEQVPATAPGGPALTLTRQGRTRRLRGVAELGRHVELSALTVGTASADRATS